MHICHWVCQKYVAWIWCPVFSTSSEKKIGMYLPEIIFPGRKDFFLFIISFTRDVFYFEIINITFPSKMEYQKRIMPLSTKHNVLKAENNSYIMYIRYSRYFSKSLVNHCILNSDVNCLMHFIFFYYVHNLLETWSDYLSNILSWIEPFDFESKKL